MNDPVVDDPEPVGRLSISWRELWTETSAVVDDQTHARWLCEVASGSTSGDEFMTLLDEPATHRMVAHLDSMLARLRRGEPLQYVLGQWSFRRVDLAIDSRVLIPRPETELVAEVALEKALTFESQRLVADLGTGSGAIGLALADELPRVGTTVWITDSSQDALDVARSNIAGLGPAGRNVRAALGSWMEALPSQLRFDVIVSNPPYVAVGSSALDSLVADWEPSEALLSGPDGLDDLRAVIRGAFDRLQSNGWLVLEIGSDQGAAVSALMSEVGYVDVEVRPDLADHDRIAMARRP